MNLDINHALKIVFEKLLSWKDAAIELIPNFIVSVLVLVLFYFLARGVKYLVARFLTKTNRSKALINLMGATSYLITLGVGLIVALEVLHLDQTVTSLLAGAGIIGLALGFAFQDISANYLAGVFIAFRKPFQVGDVIQYTTYFGEIEEVNLRSTLLKTFQGLHVIIPNKELFQNPYTNLTYTSQRRIDLEIGVSYGDDLEKAKNVAERAIKSINGLIRPEEAKVFYTEFGSSSINFLAVFWIEYPNEPGYLEIRSSAIMAIKKAFDENDITIPFPIRTLDFGIKGGKQLAETKLQLAQTEN